ncbi:MAG TPA: HupE/UreJ family protein [Casimicrobiaceae bacterium]|nr:HupE/UreJ family protein [Casimicrobiaceae bacterium]
MRTPALLRALIGIVVAAPTTVLAHPGFGDAHDALHGFLHPIGGLDHVLAMVAVGFVAARLGGRALWAVPGAFLVAMALGGVIGMAGLAMPSPEVFIALSVVTLGVVIASGVRLSVAVLAGAVAFFAVFHGFVHGLESNDVHSGIAYGVGFVCGTALLHLVGIGVGRTVQGEGLARRQYVARAGGAAVALAGVAMLAAL